MPLFKLAAALESSTSDGTIVFAVPVVDGAFGADCSLSIPRMRVAGKFQDIANGDVWFHATSVDGEVLVASLLAGEVIVPTMSAYGEMKTDSVIGLRLLRIDGAVVVTGVIDGSLRMHSLGVAGEVHGGEYFDGNIELYAPVVFGRVSLDARPVSSGAITLRRVSAFGYVSNSVQASAQSDGILKYVGDRRYI